MIDEAVVVAGDQPGRRVAGLPVLERTLLTLARAGVKRAHVVGELPAGTRAGGMTVERLDSLAAAGGAVRAPFLLVLPDRVFEPALVELVAAADPAGADVWVAGGSADAPQGCGLWLVAGPALLRALEGGDGSPAGALAQVPGARALSIGDRFWQDVGSPAGRERAERELFRRLRKAVDGPVARLVNRPISLRVTRLLIDTRVTPNQMSVVAGLVGLAGVAVVAAAQGFAAVLLGAALIDAQSILDGCDGEIARLKFLSSKAGEWIDNGTDDALNVLYCAALGIAAARLLDAPALRWIGLAGGAGYALFMVILNYQLATVHHSGSPFVFRWWFQPAGADLHATLSRPGLGTRLAAAFRALGRRDVMLLAFVGLAAAHWLQVATVWYAVIGLSNGGIAVAHVALGGIENARRAEREKRGR